MLPYQKRTGLSKEDRVREIGALHAAADNGPAFKAALADAGYILARGERGYIVVDRKGGHSVLSRNTGLKKKEVEAFMKGVELDSLPTIDEAKAVQAERRKTVPKSDAPEKAKEKGVEASKFLKPEAPPKAPEPTPAPPDPEIEALKKKIAEAEAAEVQKLKEYFALEQRRLEFQLDTEKKNSTALRQSEDLSAIDNLKAEIRERRSGVKGIWEALEDRWNPQLRAERAAERRREIAQLKRRQAKERQAWELLEEQTRRQEIENLKERQARQLRDRQQKFRDEEERRIREHEKAKVLLAEIEAQEKELKKNESLREGPEPPELGKKI